MKIEMKSTNGLIVVMLVVAALAVAFWVLALSPKRDEVSELGTEVTSLEASLSQHRSEVAEAVEARKEFPVAYQQLVVLGKAVPADDDTASMLVQLNRIADRSGVSFRVLKIEPAAGGETAEPASVAPGGPGVTPAPPTEVAASTLPLGAAIGPAGLAVMPYTLTFEGDFFKIADFIGGLDSLVKTQNEKVEVSGRLFTLSGFALKAAPDASFPDLEATFSVTTYLTPPSQGLAAGVAPEGSLTAGAPAAATLGGTP